jgi:hypothetical protein
MAVILTEYPQTITGPDGLRCRARACALSTPKGAWQGWIEFNPIDGAPTFRSPREVEHRSMKALSIWADTLTPPALEQSLQRALRRLAPIGS